MTRARSTLVSLSDTPYYHCISRCVRRAFLCGVDHYTNQSYEHRRQWLEDKLHEVAEAFAIRLCAYAIMSNHYHVVLHVRSDLADEWSDLEVVERWHTLFSGNLLSQRFVTGEPLNSAQRDQLTKIVALWRSRLCDLSWFMRIVNEAIARQANQEDGCKGRFWEGRFRSQETSEHTGVKARIDALEAHQPTKTND